jgi:hypothetical protein
MRWAFSNAEDDYPGAAATIASPIPVARERQQLAAGCLEAIVTLPTRCKLQH